MTPEEAREGYMKRWTALHDGMHVQEMLDAAIKKVDAALLELNQCGICGEKNCQVVSDEPEDAPCSECGVRGCNGECMGDGLMGG